MVNDRILNYRIVVFCTITLLLGVFVGALILDSLFLTIIIPAVYITVGIIVYILKKKHTVWILALCFAIGIASINIDNVINFSGEIIGEHDFSARVAQCESKGKVVLEDIIVDDKEIKGKAIFYETGLEVGNEIVAYGNFETIPIDVFDTYSGAHKSESINYLIKYGDTVYVEEGEINFFEKLKKKITDGIDVYTVEADAGIIESLLFGDKFHLSEEDDELIKNAGLAHVFAVSGLHIGFLAGIIFWLLKKIGINNAFSLAITVIVLLGYGMVTGFPAGVKRAIVMLIVATIAKIIKTVNDGLTSLSVATGLIVLTNPFELFDVSLIMSVCAVLGIIVFYQPLYSLFSKVSSNKIYQYAIKLLVTTITANVFLLPITSNVFNTVNVLSPLGNLLILPIITVLFVFLAPVAILTAIYSGCSVCFYIAKYPLIIIRAISKLIYLIPYSTIETLGMGIGTAFYLLAFFLLSRYIKIPNKVKVPVSISSFCAYVLCVIFI